MSAGTSEGRLTDEELAERADVAVVEMCDLLDEARADLAAARAENERLRDDAGMSQPTAAMIEALYAALIRENWQPPFTARAADYPSDEDLFAASREAERQNVESVRAALRAALSGPVAEEKP